jgi:hypothetical protein
MNELPPLPDDAAAVSESTRLPRPDASIPRWFTKLEPGAPLPPGIEPDAQRYSLVVIEEARAGKKAVKRFVPDADGEFVGASREMMAEHSALFASTSFSAPARISFGALAVGIVALMSLSPGIINFSPLLFLAILAVVAMLTYRAITGKNPFVKDPDSLSFLALADPLIPLADDDPISRPAGGFLDQPASRVGPGGGEQPPSIR